MLTTQGLGIVAHQKTLIDDIHLQFRPATLYGIIGHNGSGKSTLIKALAGQTKPSHGQISLNGTPLSQIGVKSLARQLAYLPQHLPEQAGMSVYDLCLLGRYPHQGFLQKPNDTDHAIVRDALERTGVNHLADNALTSLSGGERTRAWLAMCLAQKTQYLLLDEPLAALDIVYQVQIINLIKQLACDDGLCVVMIIHDLNLASRFCDELVALKQGKVCYQGRADTLMNQDILQEIFGVNLQILTHPQTGQKVAVV